jgi:hypothetical protein
MHLVEVVEEEMGSHLMGRVAQIGLALILEGKNGVALGLP